MFELDEYTRERQAVCRKGLRAHYCICVNQTISKRMFDSCLAGDTVCVACVCVSLFGT